MIPLFKTTPIFHQPLPSCGKSLNPLFFKKFRKLNPPPFIKGVGGELGGGSNYAKILYLTDILEIKWEYVKRIIFLMMQYDFLNQIVIELALIEIKSIILR